LMKIKEALNDYEPEDMRGLNGNDW
jgi:hypothetical protein